MVSGITRRKNIVTMVNKFRAGGNNMLAGGRWGEKSKIFLDRFKTVIYFE